MTRIKPLQVNRLRKFKEFARPNCSYGRLWLKKQGKANSDYANASSDYATKSEEIKKLEAQLETLAKQGTDLGAKISKGNVTDSKTLDEIKSFTEQVKNNF